ncbi:hypothetical protein K458DRAFT_414208 [Lentithecium fluviatile CBS 122367]|uniref:Uncharacterized protein n=1 Tax=Lentithecium fluviatile CBS 122367 TaxID=1168545 RepID=A0A6G1JD23_9PLEO|nr:hypothetical protein K458DRAFT_414208 [Lentithecium fluviatile CBS 122367]
MAAENLYIVKRTFLDTNNPGQKEINVALPATFTDLKAAKNEAKNVLTWEGYETEFFSVYDVNDGTKEWKHGDGVIVYAEGPSGERFKVEIDTIPNALGLKAEGAERVQTPLYHVLQTVIEYDMDRSGAQRSNFVQGSFTSVEEAREQALKALLDADMSKEDFVEYDEYSDGTEGPFGQDVVVHAVKEGGQNVLVSVISER